LNSGFEPARPRVGEIFSTWLLVGIQSFGGGSSTFYLIHRAVTGRNWVGEDEFIRAWALAQIAPGINLVKLTVMLGYRLRGWSGLLAAIAGLLLPSATITVLMTAGFATIRGIPLIQSMMKGILPAAIGLSLAMSVQMAQPLFSRVRAEGPLRTIVYVGILVSAALLLAAIKVSPVAVLLLAGVAAILLLAVIPVQCPERSSDKSVR
jgi:chromate transporter